MGSWMSHEGLDETGKAAGTENAVGAITFACIDTTSCRLRPFMAASGNA